MKKSLIVFYAKIALSVGVPVVGIATAIAVFNNESQINQDEIHIIETEQSHLEESNIWNDASTGTMENDFTAAAATNAATGVTIAAQPTVESSIMEPTTEAPTKPVPTEPTTETPTKPAPTEPTTETPTKPTPAEPTTGAVTASSFEVKYTYDLLGRVVKAEYENYILEYVYDKNGNILKINKTLK